MTRWATSLLWYPAKQALAGIRGVWRPLNTAASGKSGKEEETQSNIQRGSPGIGRSIKTLTSHPVDIKVRSANPHLPVIPVSALKLQTPESERHIDIVKAGDGALKANKKPYEVLPTGVPQTLPPSEEEIFCLRLAKIWDGLMKFPRSQQCENMIRSATREVWLSRITEHTSARVKSLLASSKAPTIAQLEALGWSDTTAAGVCLCVIESIEKKPSAKKKTYVYVSSASKYAGGLKMRRRKILSSPRTQINVLERKLKSHDLVVKEKFVLLFKLPLKDVPPNDIMNARELVTMTRAVFLVWLGARNEWSTPASKHLVPWDLEDIEYLGLADDNPMATKFREDKTPRRRSRLQQRKQKGRVSK